MTAQLGFPLFTALIRSLTAWVVAVSVECNARYADCDVLLLRNAGGVDYVSGYEYF